MFSLTEDIEVNDQPKEGEYEKVSLVDLVKAELDVMAAKAMDNLGIDNSFEVAEKLRTWSLSAACVVWDYDCQSCSIGNDIVSSIFNLREPVFQAEYRIFEIEQREMEAAEEYELYGDQVNINADNLPLLSSSIHIIK
ncbi:MAG: hypothetical protein CMB99_02875 [Flavobacteriaceae bacterium]|nr:hypothetical protein [Flavobacteriaceae bacterium]|tara:strand:+ start:1638 stop:2051 length:414 start_codon:yes stop_codon:yes gene_type:complete